MRKLRLRIVLPIIAVLLAGVLLKLGSRETGPPGLDLFAPTANMLCYGINAPAVMLTVPYNSFVRWYANKHLAKPWFVWEALGFYDSEWFFLFFVCLTWFMVGRSLDRYRNSMSLSFAGSGIRNWILGILFISMGSYLIYAGVFQVWRQPGNNPFGNKIEGILFIAWSLLMLGKGILLLRPRRWIGRATEPSR